MRLIHLLLFCITYVVAQSTQVMVDDSLAYSPSYPQGIQYFGSSWLTNNTNHNIERFNGTSHVARTRGDGFIFSFRGTSISWFADGDRFGGPITLLLDGAGYVVNNSAPVLTLKTNLWTSPTLDSNDHQVVVINTGGTLIGLDNFAITPNSGTNDVRPTNLGPGAINVPSGAVLVDSSDSTVNYTGSSWQPVTGAYFQQSMQQTNNPGDSCSFTFTGTQALYFVGDFNDSAPVSISVDGGTPEKVDNVVNGRSTFLQKLLWNSSTLNDGQHTVMITHAGNAGEMIGLDFFMYQPSNSSASNGSGGSGSSGNSNTSNGSGNADNNKSTPTGAIVGGVMGGLVLLGLVAFGVFLLRRRGFGSRSDRTSIKYYPSYSAYHTGKEGTITPEPPHTQNYGTGGLDSPQLGPTAGGMSVNTHFSAPGYTGYPEVHEAVRI
ncbi:hypothetical protein FRC12_021769 [Ceratobasidium sp. 428]|nr:hypothetical protein FRC12_021769 [Ceratobasidium sp. 428]